MSKRTADLDLDWTRCLGDYAEYEAWLPALPGYPEMGDKDSLVYVAPSFGEYTFWMEIAVGDSQIIELTDKDFDIPLAGSAEEMMQEVASLSVQDILDALTAIGWGPDDEDATASRHASRKGNHMIRKASMSLDWEDTGNGSVYKAPLPYIPGYPCADGFSDYVEVADLSGFEGTGWCFTMYLSLQNEDVNLYNEDFGIPYTDTAEEMMDIVGNLNPQEIADALVTLGCEPVEE